MEKRQLRLTLPVTCRQEQRQVDGQDVTDMIVEGYAFKYDCETVLWEDSRGYQYREVIERGALDGVDLSDVPFKYNHNDGVFIVARTRNGSLELIPDEVGLFCRARFIDTQTGRDFYKMIQEGLIDKMSYAYTEADNFTEEYSEKSVTHHVRGYKRIWDVSGVDIPAYDQTEIYARSISILDERKKEWEKQQKQRLDLKLKLNIDLLEEL